MLDLLQAYFITFRTYGTWLHGDSRGSQHHRECHAPGSASLPPNLRWRQHVHEEMRGEPFLLSSEARRTAHEAIVEACRYRRWELLAANVRTNHVHVVVRAESSPERAMSSMKAWSTRRLRESGLVGEESVVWARHGSTRYLRTSASVERAVRYVNEGQG